ncbi:flavin reductase family protein [Marinobacterium aestuariivivens]|uniref:Flavin reductase family protein n=1 Tax=Marinobacterium aestuariivivens TaxID=1698799 RepID=A0ABW2A3M5_9GAMM
MTQSAEQQLKDQMRTAMRRLAQSVTIISSSNGRERFAMAATAVNSLSTEPPSLLVCVNRSAAMHGPLSEGNDFCVNILGREQEELSVACGGKLRGEDRFSAGNWAISDAGTPYLNDAQASLLCSQDGAIDYGTHTIFIGRIKEIRNTAEIDPLIYLDGAYTTSAAMETA